MRLAATVTILFVIASPVFAAQPAFESSEDGHQSVLISNHQEYAALRSEEVYYSTTPDWANDLRRQVGALQIVDMNNDGWNDIVVGCYHSNSYPPYDDWHNFIYYNINGELESTPSWISADERSTTDLQVGDLNQDGYPDIVAANGGGLYQPSVIYWGTPTGPDTNPGWFSDEPSGAYSLHIALFDFDHDNDLDIWMANQGIYPDSFRPIYGYENDAGTIPTAPTWQAAQADISNFLAVGDYDNDGWEDLACSKWANFETSIYRNINGTLQTSPIWSTGDDDTDKGVALADLDQNGWLDLAVGGDPLRVWSNEYGILTLDYTTDPDLFYGPQDLRVCDVNRDGFLDVGTATFSNGHARIYLNIDGTLQSLPAWIHDSSNVCNALAFGDLNGDNWPDLVVGDSGDPSVKVFYAEPPYQLGDLNCDGVINNFDIDAFVLAITDPEGYAAAYPACDIALADVNQDGLINNFDIDPFVALLTEL